MFAEFGASGGVALGDNPTWTGNHTFNGSTAAFGGTSVTVTSGYLAMNDNRTLYIGSFGVGESGKLSSDGTDVTFENAFATGKIINKLGTATSATEFQVADSAGEAQLTVQGDGVVKYAALTQALTGNANITAGARVVILTADGDDYVATLQAGAAGQIVTVVNGDTDSNTIDLLITLFYDPNDSGVAANTTFTMTNSGQGITLVSDGNNWLSISGGLDPAV